MMDRIVGLAVFVAVFCLTIAFMRGIWRAYISPEFKDDLRRLREQRRRRREARRKI